MRESVAGRGRDAHGHPVVLGRLPILQHRRGAVHVADDEIEIAVVVEIADGKAAADRRDLQACACALRHVAESGAEVQEQLVLLAVGFAELRECVDVREDVAVGEEQIELAVEVGVEKGGAPAHAAEGGGRDTRRRRRVLEVPAVDVVIQRVAIVRECREHQIHPRSRRRSPPRRRPCPPGRAPSPFTATPAANPTFSKRPFPRL